MPSISMKGKIVISCEIEAVTGLHIGGATGGLDIGGGRFARPPSSAYAGALYSRFITAWETAVTVRSPYSYTVKPTHRTGEDS